MRKLLIDLFMTLKNWQIEERKLKKIRQDSLERATITNIHIAEQRLQKLLIAEALMNMVSQHCYYDEDKKGFCDGCLSANEDAFIILLQLGLMRKRRVKGEKYSLLWNILERRKKKLYKIIREIKIASVVN